MEHLLTHAVVDIQIALVGILPTLLIVCLQDNALPIGTADLIQQITCSLVATMDSAHAILDLQDIHQVLNAHAEEVLHGLTEFPIVATMHQMILDHALPMQDAFLDFVTVESALSLQK